MPLAPARVALRHAPPQSLALRLSGASGQTTALRSRHRDSRSGSSSFPRVVKEHSTADSGGFAGRWTP